MRVKLTGVPEERRHEDAAEAAQHERDGVGHAPSDLVEQEARHDVGRKLDQAG